MLKLHFLKSSFHLKNIFYRFRSLNFLSCFGSSQISPEYNPGPTAPAQISKAPVASRHMTELSTSCEEIKSSMIQ